MEISAAPPFYCQTLHLDSIDYLLPQFLQEIVHYQKNSSYSRVAYRHINNIICQTDEYLIRHEPFKTI